MEGTSKSDDWLNLFLWTFETLMRPTTSTILGSFESWNYRNNLRPQLHQLKRRRYLETDPADPKVWRLTERGRLAASGGVDPLARWERPWDGQWRLLLFDLPSDKRQLRLRLWRWLRAEKFGYLQLSVWLTPDALNETTFPLRHLKLKADALTVIEGRPAAPDSDEGIVSGAWDFAAINRRYEKVISVCAAGRKLMESADRTPAQMRQWLAADREAWGLAMEDDPLLPKVLLPEGYLGREAWAARKSVYEWLVQASRKN